MGQQRPFGLIDIFYRDMTRIDSFLAQLQKGALRKVTLKSGETQGSKHSKTGAIGIPTALKGEYGKTSEEIETNGIEQTKDPHDSLIISLLDDLGLPVSESVPDSSTSKLMLLRGNIELRNYDILKQIIPIFAEHPELTNPQLYSIDNKLIHGKEKQALQRKKEDAKKPMEQMKGFIKLIPTGLGIDLFIKSGQMLSGSLRPEFMVDLPDAVFRIFGPSLPGQWYVLAIVDTEATERTYKSSNLVHRGIDDMAKMVKNLLSSNDSTSMVPLLIFRELNLEGNEQEEAKIASNTD